MCTHTPPTTLSTLSLHDALPISSIPPNHPERQSSETRWSACRRSSWRPAHSQPGSSPLAQAVLDLSARSEEHTSELQSRQYLVCRLLLEKKKKNTYIILNILPLY